MCHHSSILIAVITIYQQSNPPSLADDAGGSCAWMDIQRDWCAPSATSTEICVAPPSAFEPLKVDVH